MTSGERESGPGAGSLDGAVAGGPFGVLLLDEGGGVLDLNSSACEVLGRPGSEILGRRLVELLHPDDRGWCETELELLLSGALDRVRQEVRVAVAGPEAWAELTVRASEADRDSSPRALVLLEDASDRELRAGELRRLADTDPLTGLFNRRRFLAELERHLERADRYGVGGALVLLDIDQLKQINDQGGHLEGDRAIVAAAGALRAQLRASDLLARLGGDEFAVLLPGATTRAQAAAVARTLRQAFRVSGEQEGAAGLTWSIGIALVVGEDHRLEVSSLLGQADAALYEVKRGGGDGFALAGEPRIHAAPPPAAAKQARRAQGSDGAARAPARNGAAGVDDDAELQTLLATVAELGAASLSLLAWELYTVEPAMEEAWTAAIRDGLLKRASYDRSEHEWLHELSDRGAERLWSLEQRPQQPAAARRQERRQEPPAGSRSRSASRP